MLFVILHFIKWCWNLWKD